MKQSTIAITDEQAAWLAAHPKINLSGLVREAIDKEIEKNDRR